MNKIWSAKLQTKLVGAFVIGSLLGAGAVAWNLSSFRWAASAFHVATRESLPALEYVNAVDRDMQRALVAERTLMFLRQASEEAAQKRKDHAENLQQAKEQWAKYKALPASDDEKEALAGLRGFLRRMGKDHARSAGPSRTGHGGRPKGRHRPLSERGRREVHEDPGHPFKPREHPAEEHRGFRR